MKLVFANPDDAQQYEAGLSYWSPDDGKTWYRGKGPIVPSNGAVKIVSVDAENGVIICQPVEKKS